jgi:hypothetical protein
MAVNRLGNISWVWPPMVSVIAGAEPLYGTCSSCGCRPSLNSSPAKCGAVPLPAEA